MKWIKTYKGDMLEDFVNSTNQMAHYIEARKFAAFRRRFNIGFSHFLLDYRWITGFRKKWKMALLCCTFVLVFVKIMFVIRFFKSSE